MHSSKLNLQNFHMTQYLVFRKLDWGSWKTSSKKYNLYSSMQFHFLFRTVKTAGPHLIPIKSYSKNTHPSSFLKWIIVDFNFQSRHCCFESYSHLFREINYPENNKMHEIQKPRIGVLVCIRVHNSTCQ
jgi:hypothetical protein